MAEWLISTSFLQLESILGQELHPGNQAFKCRLRRKEIAHIPFGLFLLKIPHTNGNWCPTCSNWTWSGPCSFSQRGGELSQPVPKQTWCAFNDVSFLQGNFRVGLFLFGVRNRIQGVRHGQQGSAPACSGSLHFLGAHMHIVVSPVYCGSTFPFSSAQHMSHFLLAAVGTMRFKSSSAIAFQGETQPAPSCPLPQTLLRSTQGMGCTRHELWDKQPIPSRRLSQGKCARGRMKGKEEVGWGHLALGGAAWGEQDNAGVHFLLQKMARLIMCSGKIYGILGCTGFFWGGFKKKDRLAEPLDVDARCIWMWFALFLNNRQF